MKFHSNFSADITEGIQKFHSKPTPRIGAVALTFGFCACWFFLAGETRELFGLIGLAGIPILVLGLAEDIYKNVSVKARLLTSLVSGVLFYFFTGYAIEHVYVWWFDYLLSFSAFSIAFTAFATATSINSINIIDGFHGLASGTVLIILLSIGLTVWNVGDQVLFQITLSIAAITFGFFIINFPFGKLFLGDGGAYFLGYLVASLAIILPVRNPEVSPWISPLILSYPLTETTVSIFRKTLRKGHHPSQPDGLHLHMLVHKIVTARRFLNPKSEIVSHAITSLSLWIFPVTSLLLVLKSDYQSFFAIWSTVVIISCYLAVYSLSKIWIGKMESSTT